MRHVSGGITGVGDNYLDLLALPFADDSVDLVYCCHVLNSLADDCAAMREVARVLQPSGVAILQVPAFFTGPTTLEPTSDRERLAAFHVEGIYRCYPNDDYERRLDDAGFDVHAFRAATLDAGLVERCQLKREVLHVCTKSPRR